MASYGENYFISSYLPTTAFCDSKNQDTCIMYLSKELVSRGFAPLYNNGSNECDEIKLINTIYILLQHFSNEKSNHEDLQDRILRLNSDLETQRCQYSRLQDKLESSEKSGQSHQEKHRQLAIKNKSLQAELKTEREECRRLQLVLQQREAQYQHEQRRRERELNQLKERLLQIMSHKTSQQAPGMTLLNGLVRQDGKRGTWTTKAVSSRNEDDFQKRILCGYEQRNKLLLEENTCFRELISTLYTEFSLAFNECEEEVLEDDVSSGSPSPPVQCLFKTAGGLDGYKVGSAVLNSWHFLRSKWSGTICKNEGKSKGTNSFEKSNTGQKVKPPEESICEQKETDRSNDVQKGVTIIKS